MGETFMDETNGSTPMNKMMQAMIEQIESLKGCIEGMKESQDSIITEIQSLK